SCSLTRPPPTSTLFPYTTLFRSRRVGEFSRERREAAVVLDPRGRDADGHARAGRRERLENRVPLGRRQLAIRPPALDRRKVLQRSEEHTSELQSLAYLVCRLLLE